jgi:hypothetical protein
LVWRANTTKRRLQMKRKLKYTITRYNKSTGEVLKAEFESEEQIDVGSKGKLGLVSDYAPLIVIAVSKLIREVVNFI